MGKQKVQFEDLGIIAYKEAWDYQTKLHELLKKDKLSSSLDSNYTPHHHSLLLCEHNPVFTIGKSGKMEHLLVNKPTLEKMGITFYNANRGGDITYHGPGQITGYPIFDLEFFKRDVHLYVRKIEQVIINVLSQFDILGERIEGKTGVWVKGRIDRKICAIGVHMSRWVTLHGFALNVSTTLSHFDFIVPCGIREANTSICSMESLLDREISMEEVKEKVKIEFAREFDFEYL